MSPPQSSVAVTGATGTLGSRVVDRLDQRDDVVVHRFTGDVTDPEAVTSFLVDARPTHVLHLAAIVDLARVDGAQDRVLAVNVGGTVNVGQALARLPDPAPWVLYSSSSHVYAPKGTPLVEEDPTGPRNFYGLTKLLGEQVITHYGAQAAAGTCVARIFSLYDERQTGGFLLPATRRRIDDADPSQPVLVPNGDSRRDFTHADELARLLLALMDVGATGCVNVGSGTARRVVDLLTHAIGAPYTFQAAPDGAVDAIVADITRLQELTADD